MGIFYSPKLKYLKIPATMSGKRIKINGTVVKIIHHFACPASSGILARISDTAVISSESIIEFREVNFDGSATWYSQKEYDGIWDVTPEMIYTGAESWLELWYFDTKRARNQTVRERFDTQA